MNSATAVAFNIDSLSATGQTERTIESQRTRMLRPSLVMLGTLLFLGSAPITDARPLSPSAIRPPVLIDLAEVDRRKTYKPSDAIEHSVSRLREFGKYMDDWDSNGAVAPKQEAIDVALQFLTSLEPWHPAPFATVSRQGEPVIEFEDSSIGFFGSIRFLSDRSVELYSKINDEPSRFVAGDIRSEAVTHFLSAMNLPTL
jgi:hypothetical protein